MIDPIESSIVAEHNRQERAWFGVLDDAVSALRYIEHHYGRLAGVGWDRVFDGYDLLVSNRDSDGTATAALCEDIAVPKDCQARAESTAQNKPHTLPSPSKG